MRLDLLTTLGLSLSGETGTRGPEPEPAVIALVDSRGRRQLIPVHGRLHRYRPQTAVAMTGSRIEIDPDFTSGTIH